MTYRCFSLSVFAALASALVAMAQTNSLPPASERVKETVQLIRPGHTIQMRVYPEDDLATRTVVDSKGMVNLPQLGSVQVGGLTVEDAAKLIQELYAKGYLVNPQVDLQLVLGEAAAAAVKLSHFSVLGQVAKPGTIDLPPEESVNLLQAIAMAGGYTRLGSPAKITLVRMENGQPKIYKLNADKMLNDRKNKPFEILPNDIITVGEKLF
ncbi:MAG: polysaccharide biosynthesis/export family protein [Verrucomicrobiota bacterium]